MVKWLKYTPSSDRHLLCAIAHVIFFFWVRHCRDTPRKFLPSKLVLILKYGSGRGRWDFYWRLKMVVDENSMTEKKESHKN